MTCNPFFKITKLMVVLLYKLIKAKQRPIFLLELANQYDFIKAVVGWVDLRSAQVEERLEYFSQFPKIKGFRHVVQDEPDENFMLGEAFQKGIGLLKKYNFTYDILIFPNQMPAALQTIKNFPEQAFVVDHIAKPYIKDQKITDWEKYIREMAKNPNVFCKISGLVTEAEWQNWQEADFKIYLDVVFDAFGEDRLMYGSDWPVCILAGAYEQVLGIIQNYIKGPSQRKFRLKFWEEMHSSFMVYRFNHFLYGFKFKK